LLARSAARAFFTTSLALNFWCLFWPSYLTTSSANFLRVHSRFYGRMDGWAKMVFDGERLTRPDGGYDEETVKQAKRNGDFVRELVEKRMGRQVYVFPVVWPTPLKRAGFAGVGDGVQRRKTKDERRKGIVAGVLVEGAVDGCAGGACANRSRAPAGAFCGVGRVSTHDAPLAGGRGLHSGAAAAATEEVF